MDARERAYGTWIPAFAGMSGVLLRRSEHLNIVAASIIK